MYVSFTDFSRGGDKLASFCVYRFVQNMEFEWGFFNMYLYVCSK